MSLQHKTFAMSTFLSQKDLFEAKAEHYMNEAEKLQMENVVLAEQNAHLERVLLETARTADRLQKQLDSVDHMLENS